MSKKTKLPKDIDTLGQSKEAANAFDMKRYEDNLELAKCLFLLIVEHPTLRFGQILENFKFVRHTTVDGTPLWEREILCEPGKILERVERVIRGHG